MIPIWQEYGDDQILERSSRQGMGCCTCCGTVGGLLIRSVTGGLDSWSQKGFPGVQSQLGSSVQNSFSSLSVRGEPAVPVSCMFTSLASSQGQSKVNPRQSLQIWHHSMKSTKLFLPMTRQVFDSKLEVFYLHHEKHLQRTHTLCISQKAPDQ